MLIRKRRNKKGREEKNGKIMGEKLRKKNEKKRKRKLKLVKKTS